MPNINRIRVNNVKYNFGTQSYDDFIMKMYGRNTLYDLANGGGKSVLMLLLMQCVIPNSTLDDKQPIEKLFRGNENTCIHSLVEWKLDDCDITEGMRYMTTGFAAKKAGGGSSDQQTIEGIEVQEAGTDEDKTTAEIEYFNYCIFYRDYNKNDIVNLPLVKGEERISYKGLRNYLLDLARTDKNIIVKVFDRKGEYQRFIAEYGLYESQWELIRGINRTEGHVRTYFETNFRTTRKIIEDLLIEEIIEKAYAVKTSAEGGTGNTASLLMTIQEELKTLAEKKKRISDYDHEKELIELLSDRIEGYAGLLREKEKCALGFADIYRTIDEEKKTADEELARLEKEREELGREKDRLRHETEQLKLGVAREERDRAGKKAEELRSELAKLDGTIEEKKREQSARIAAGEFLDYIAARDKLAALDAEKKNSSSSDKKLDIGCIVYNIRLRMEEKRAELSKKESELAAKRDRLLAERESVQKLHTTAIQETAVTESRICENQSLYEKSVEKTRTLGEELSDRRLLPPAELLSQAEKKKKQIEETIDKCSRKLEELAVEIESAKKDKASLEQTTAVLREQGEHYKNSLEEQKTEAQRLRSLADIYGIAGNVSEDTESVGKLAEKIQAAIMNDYIRVHESSKAVEASEKRLADIEMGVVLKRSVGVERVKDYIITRHNLSAISGIDYISLQPEEKRKKLLQVNPSLPYGVVVENLSSITDDPGLTEIETADEIMLYDKDSIETAHNIIGENVFPVRRPESYFSDEEVIKKLKNFETEQLRLFREEEKAVRDMLLTKQEDLAFTEIYIGKGYDSLLQNIKNNERELLKTEDDEAALDIRLRKLSDEERAEKDILEEASEDIKTLEKDIEILRRMAELTEEQRKLTRESTELRSIKDNSERALSDYDIKQRRLGNDISDTDALLAELKETRHELEFNWEKRYSVHYTDSVRPDLNMSLSELTSLFEREAAKGEGDLFTLEKEKLLRDTLTDSMRRIEESIKRKGISMNDLAAESEAGELFRTPEAEMERISRELAAAEENRRSLSDRASAAGTEYERLVGKLEYAEKNMRDAYGADLELPPNLNYEEEIAARKERLAETEAAIQDADKRLKSFKTRVSGSEELLRYSGRIVEKENLKISDAKVIPQDTDLRAYFDDLILEYDRIGKNIDKTRSDTLKVKMMVIDSLNEVGATELALSIREDVELPDTRSEAEGLYERLEAEASLISLEKERIETSLQGMERLRENFIDQCLERCLDVKTELGKIAHLSEITLDDERIEMIRLSIPYVKPEFMKDRMSEYIDRVVADLDKKPTESERQKFLNQSLSMKKLFSVIVTDMNKIKLSLYKRERIKEQSRYLKYEEAVGSTGQSQGIYIQFLISVINYISGMYSAGDGQKRTKTLFIDNPFGAAKDIYIWEPIFKLLQENTVQLVVPTRGATPEITGRFDVNYILGQQKTGNRQTTVVVNFTSKTSAEELEYTEFDYQQQTFNFI